MFNEWRKKKAPFPVTDESHKTRSVFINVPLQMNKTEQKLDDMFETFVNDPSEQDKRPSLKRLCDMEKSDQGNINSAYYEKQVSARYSFLHWLLQQDRLQTWHFLASEQTLTNDDKLLLPGCYPPSQKKN